MINQLETFNELSLIISSSILLTDDKSSLDRTVSIIHLRLLFTIIF